MNEFDRFVNGMLDEKAEEEINQKFYLDGEGSDDSEEEEFFDNLFLYGEGSFDEEAINDDEVDRVSRDIGYRRRMNRTHADERIKKSVKKCASKVEQPIKRAKLEKLWAEWDTFYNGMSREFRLFNSGFRKDKLLRERTKYPVSVDLDMYTEDIEDNTTFEKIFDDDVRPMEPEAVMEYKCWRVYCFCLNNPDPSAEEWMQLWKEVYGTKK